MFPGFDNASYLCLLENYVIPSIHQLYKEYDSNSSISDLIYVQDNARVHTANKDHKISNEPNAFDILKTNGLKCEDWPPYIPDLSPIENVWSLVDIEKNKLVDKLQRPPKDKKESFKLIQKAWDKVSNQSVINCYRSFQERMKMVVDRNGDNDFNYSSKKFKSSNS